MLTKILIGVAVLIVVFAIVVATRPTEFQVTRTATMSAPPAEVFAQVNDFHAWQEWSPWAKIDPDAKSTFAGPSAGTGANFKWSGNSEVGEGSMTITESRPNELILIDLEFIRPFAGTNTTEFTFQPQGDQTAVTWTMSGKNNFMAKAIGLFIDCDEMMGGQFEKGLASMKAIVEAEPQPKNEGHQQSDSEAAAPVDDQPRQTS